MHLPTLQRPRTPDAAGAETDSFYHLREVDLRGACCQGLACFVARHLDSARWELAQSQPQRAYCLGKCYRGPSSGRDNESPKISVDSRQAIVLERIINGGARSISQYREAGGYQGLSTVLSRPPQRIIDAVEKSGLRGRGGAGFPTGRKWRMAFQQQSRQKHIVVNADEGDPGAYIDRFILEDDPHCLLEAMAIAGYAVGASKGWIYLRCEYPDAATTMRTAIEEARASGYFGSHVCGTDFAFDLELVIGRGSYMCGEETALLNSIEGKRPVAMARPPYATEAGLFGQPTVINNVETLANIPWIIRNGADAHHALGFSSSRGTKVISLNSLFRKPGLYEVEFGIPVRHIVEDLGGGLKSGALKGLIIGGPLAGVIPPHLLDTLFGFEELHSIGAAVGHGGVIAFDEHTSIPELVHHVFSFGAYESCGKCVPCRLGSRRIENIFAEPSGSSAHEWEEIISALKMASLCGFGTGLGEFAASVVRYYNKELDQWFA